MIEVFCLAHKVSGQDDPEASGGDPQQLQDFVEEFADELGRGERRQWCGKYLEGLLREGERKSIEPLAARVGGDHQAMQQFVNQSPWDHRAVLFRLQQLMRPRMKAGGVLVLDDTSLPKQGAHAVGVARQYCGALGKIANCQSLVTWHWVSAGLHWPLAAELYLPAAWTDEPTRMTQAGVPPEAQRFREKWRIALDLLKEMKPQLPADQALVFDAGQGVVQPLWAELEKRDEVYLAQVPGNVAAWPAEAVAALIQPAAGRPRQPAIVRDPAGAASHHDRLGGSSARTTQALDLGGDYPGPMARVSAPLPCAGRLPSAAAVGVSPESAAGC
ncbi:MAG: IS701 family transposase [Lacunisphaera sp.]